jgi:hypothetical protein
MSNMRIVALLAGALWSVAALGSTIKTITAGATDQTVTVKVIDNTTGLPVTGLAFNSSGIDLKYWRHGANAVTSITEATQTANGAHADGGFVELGNGMYRLDLPDAAVAASATAVDVFGTITGYVVIGGTVNLTTDTPQTGDSFARLGAPAGASHAADIAAIENQTDDIGAAGAGLTALASQSSLDTLDNLVDTEIADIRRAIGPPTTTIASLASQTSFTLTAGSADDNAYNGWGLMVVDASTDAQRALGCVLDYTGLTRTVTLREDPGIFTMATTDNAVLLPAYCTSGVDVDTIEGLDATDQLDTHAAAGLDAAGVRSALGLASANLDTQLSTIDNYVDSEVAALVTAVDVIDNFLDSEIAAILANTDAILIDTSTTLDDFMDTELAAILAAVDTEVADLPTNAELATALGTADDAVLTAVDALPTNAELATSQGTADDATLAVIATLQTTADAIPTNAELATALGTADDATLAAIADIDTAIFDGTADSGDSDTLVDAALTARFVSNNDIDAAYVVRSDGQRCNIDSFTEATGTIEFLCTFTGAWSTQTYDVYPAGQQ